MRRRLLTGLSLLSLVLVVLSICCQRGLVQREWTFSQLGYSASCPHDYLSVGLDRAGIEVYFQCSSWSLPPLLVLTTHGCRFAWVEIGRDSNSNRVEMIAGQISHPSVIFIASLLPAWSLLSRYRTRLTRKAGPTCSDCGYNLTANTSGICPECGTPTAAGAKA